MGMDLTDEQIERMQNMMNPETLKMMKNIDPSALNMGCMPPMQEGMP